MEEFLALLADDMLARPELVAPFSPDLVERIAALTADISVDLPDEIVGVVSF